jgi:transcriptional regulator GlxA family with amidase domain
MPFRQADLVLPGFLSGQDVPSRDGPVERGRTSLASGTELNLTVEGHSLRVDRDAEQRVAIVVLPNFTLLSLGCIIDTLRLANRVAGREIYHWSVVGLEERAIASCKLGVVVDARLAEVQGTQVDIVIVCGGIDGHLHNERSLRSWLRDLDHRGVVIGAISTGIWPIARAGLLDGRRCAVHWDDIASFSASFALVDVQPDIFVHDGRRLTCSGGVAVIDMVLHIVAMKYGAAFADHVADLLIHARIRAPEEKQRRVERVESPALGSVKRVVQLMERHIGTVMSIDDMARSISRSPRQLERLFAEAFQTSPKRYYDSIRLRHARKLLAETDMPLSEIASRCGYASQGQFSSRFRILYAKAPLRYRQSLRG